MSPSLILLLTRPRAQSLAFGDACRAAGFAGGMVISPVIAIVPVPFDAEPAPGTVLLFTSLNGVEQAVAQTGLRGFAALAVGDRTATAARAAGMPCGSAAGTVDDLLRCALDIPDRPFLHLRGRHATGDLTARLRAAGRRADDRVVYDQQEQPLNAAARATLSGRVPVILPLFSPRSATILGAQTESATASIYPLAISEATARNWPGPVPPRVAARPDGGEMLRLIVAIAQN